MKNLTLLSLIYFLLFTQTIAQETHTIKIYHGRSGQSTILNENGRSDSKNKTYRFKKGDTVIVEVINAHPALYEYELIESQTDIKAPKLPDLSGISSFITSNINSVNKNQLDNIKRAHAALLIKGKVKAPLDEISWIEKYSTELESWVNILKKAENTIIASDIPQSIPNAFDAVGNNGFLKAQYLFSLAPFNRDIDKLIANFQSNIKSNPAAPYKKDDINEKFLMQTSDSYLKTIGERLKQIKSSYDQTVISTYSKKLAITEDQLKIILKVTPKNKVGKRDKGELVKIIVIPDYDRPLVELVPVAIMTQTNNGKQFGIQNGIITESDKDNFDFSTGVLLNVNALNWGTRNQMSWAIGAGFALADQNLDNFFFNTSINVGDWVRLGIGYGWLNTPTGLKNGLEVGANATNINDINEVTKFSKESTVFFTLVIPGINLPVSK